MAKRGRKSGEDIALSPVVERTERPNAPLDLTPEESDVWVATVNAMPADWFQLETWPLLTQWCRHTVSARRVSQMIEAAASRKDVEISEMKDLLGMQAKETTALKSLGAAMRLSQQASYSARGAGGQKSRRKTVSRPWE